MAIVIRNKRTGAHARGSLIIPHFLSSVSSLFFVLHPMNFPGVRRNCNWSDVPKSRLSGEYFDVLPRVHEPRTESTDSYNFVASSAARTAAIIATAGTSFRDDRDSEITKRHPRIPRLERRVSR